MVKLLDRVKMTVSGTPGTSNITLNAAEAGFQTFAQAGAVDTNVVRYAVTDGTGFEIGTAVLSSSATVMARTVQQSSNSNNALNLTSNAVVFATLSAADFSGNAAPIWTTTPPSTLSLGADGSTAVTLAGVAIDEFPVHYSWDGYAGTTVYNDSNLPPQLASAPTFSGGTASLIGSSTSSNAGSFNFRLKASDGVKTATAITAVNLSFTYDVSLLSYTTSSNAGYAQESRPFGLAFNSDGTKMFKCGTTSDSVIELDLTTGFSVASGNVSYNNAIFSVASQDTAPQAIVFNSDGTKMFVLGGNSRTVYQFSLTTGFSLASGNVSYNNLSFSVATQDTTPTGMAFNSDGTKMFVIGRTGDKVYQYSLSTGFSLASGNVSYDNLDFSVATQETDPTGMAFNSDGTKMFVIGFSSDKVHQFSLSTGYSLAAGNVSYSNKSFSVASENTNPSDIAWSADGTKMFFCSNSGGRVYQYNIGT